MSELNEIFNKHESDKGTVGNNKSTGHHYYLAYEKVFKKFKNKQINLLEIGVWRGLSFKSYLDYFSKAELYGIDTFDRVAWDSERVRELRKDKRIHFKKADSTVKNSLWGEDTKFDIIIDDGNHTPVAQYQTFKAHWDKVKKGGSYFIEDVLPCHLMNEIEIRSFPMSGFSSLLYNDLYNEMKSLKAIEHDLRSISGKPDSFIFEIRK